MEESSLNKCLFALGLLGSIAGCAGGRSPSAPPPTRPSAYRVLFIGNSLTYTNDLPGTVAAMALAAGDTIQTETVAARGRGHQIGALGLRRAPAGPYAAAALS